MLPHLNCNIVSRCVTIKKALPFFQKNNGVILFHTPTLTSLPLHIPMFNRLHSVGLIFWAPQARLRGPPWSLALALATELLPLFRPKMAAKVCRPFTPDHGVCTDALFGQTMRSKPPACDQTVQRRPSSEGAVRLKNGAGEVRWPGPSPSNHDANFWIGLPATPGRSDHPNVALSWRGTVRWPGDFGWRP